MSDEKKISEAVQDHYSVNAMTYRNHYDPDTLYSCPTYPAEFFRLRNLVDRVKELGCKRVIDAGCGEGTPLLPDDRKAEIWQWLFAALNTVELSVMHWVSMILAERVPEFFGPPPAADVKAHAKADMDTKLTALQQALGDKEWLAGDFSVADIAMVEVLRVVAAEEALDAYPHLAAYVERATSRPAFKKAMADHMQHWQAADAEQAKRSTG